MSRKETPIARRGDFRSFEQAGWEKAAGRYHDAFGELTGQSIGPLLNAVGAGGGVRLLDVASGPGYVAASAAQRGAEVVGVDFSAAMVAEARRRYPDIEFREGDAEALAFPDRFFDAVVMNYGLLHLGRPERALAEMRRVLRSGGRAGFTVWSRPEETVGFRIVLGAVESHGDINVPLPPGPPFFRFSEPQECHRALLEAGFVDPRVERIPQIWRLRSPDTLFEIMSGATVRTAGLLRAQSREALDAIRSAVREASLNYLTGGVIELPMPAVLASAARP
ncbi:MAG: methyltransferase domain-containing protein [Candidatus Binatota bacterium]